MADTTPRLALPLLAAGQAQKEIFHNEALAALDMLVQPCVESAGVNDPPPSPTIGQSWIVGASPTGEWAAQAHTIAGWSDGGWRFAAPQDGMMIWVADQNLFTLHRSGAWRTGEIDAAEVRIGGLQVIGSQQSAISSPSGGTTIDAEARDAIGAILVALRTHGLISV